MVKYYVENTKTMSERRAPSLYDSKMSMGYHYIDIARFRAWYDCGLFSCRFIAGGDPLEQQLVNSRAPEKAVYSRTYLRASATERITLTRAFCTPEKNTVHS